MPLQVDAQILEVLYRALSETSRTVFDPNDYRFRTFTRTRNDSWVVRATGGGSDVVFRLISQADKTPESERRARLLEGEHIATQLSLTIGQFDVIQREHLKRVFTAQDLIRESRQHTFDKYDSQHFVQIFLDHALLGLQNIHDAGQVHGDLRPEKFGYLGGRDLVVRDVGVRFLGNIMPSRYLAPELLDVPDSLPTPSSDIYAVLKVAGDLLKPYRGDSRASELARLDAQVRWLQDYYHPRTDRPSAGALRNFLLHQEIDDSTQGLDGFLDAFNDASRRVFFSWRRGTRMKELGRNLRNYPETRFAIDDSESGKRIARWLAASKSRSTKREMTSVSQRVQDFTSGTFPDVIDDRWMNSIHRAMFGIAIDPDHDRRMQHLSPEEAEDRSLYLSAVDLANKARASLLDDNSFLSTREAIGALDKSRFDLQRADFMVLRRWGYILAVPDHGRWLYPAFQFNGGSYSPHIYAVHDVLRSRRDGEPPNPWIELSFWSLRRDELEGRALKDVLWRQNQASAISHLIKNAKL